MPQNQPFVPYPPIEKHGVIGDRRTAALVAADGTIDWLCLPDYDSPTVFAALLDVDRGGFWRMGPAEPVLGQQYYLEDSAAVVTTWDTDGYRLELTDIMAWPEDARPPGTESRRIILRRLRCVRGEARCITQIVPRLQFDRAAEVTEVQGGAIFDLDFLSFGIWSSLPLAVEDGGAINKVVLEENDELWAILGSNEAPTGWTVSGAHGVFVRAVTYWQGWLDGITYDGPHDKWIRRSALTVHLLHYEPAGSLVAAPTTSLPERIGGDRNYDYRFAWIRDASLSLSILSLLGQTLKVRKYMDWLSDLESSIEAPLQVVYRVDGGADLTQTERTDLEGYRGSLPIRFGNHAFHQFQLDSLGYLAECVLIYLEQGGLWKEQYWETIDRITGFTATNWQRQDNGIWELLEEHHYVSSKVMSWVVLDRAIKIGERLGKTGPLDAWRKTRDEIHDDVMERGWSERRQAFRQRYDSDALDASTLLIAVMGFLPADHPRVLATIERIEEELTIDGFVHRFLPEESPVEPKLPLGEYEGAFLPCTFWMATAYAKLGEIDRAEAILRKAEAVAGALMLFAEEVDVKTHSFLGNTPLLFSQMEYVRAILELNRVRPVDRARHAVGRVREKLSHLLGTHSQSPGTGTNEAEPRAS